MTLKRLPKPEYWQSQWCKSALRNDSIMNCRISGYKMNHGGFLSTLINV